MTSTSEDHGLLPYKYITKLINKSSWARGSWNQEPDLLTFTSSGLPCAIIRTGLGHLCGYVGVPQDHPYANGQRNISDLSVHGGVTWNKAGEENDLFWIGFDCGHFGDRSPGMESRERSEFYYNGSLNCSDYKDISYVRCETENLATQLASAKPLSFGPGPFIISETGLLVIKKLFQEQWDEDGFKIFCESHITPTHSLED